MCSQFPVVVFPPGNSLREICFRVPIGQVLVPIGQVLTQANLLNTGFDRTSQEFNLLVASGQTAIASRWAKVRNDFPLNEPSQVK